MIEVELEDFRPHKIYLHHKRIQTDQNKRRTLLLQNHKQSVFEKIFLKYKFIIPEITTCKIGFVLFTFIKSVIIKLILRELSK